MIDVVIIIFGLLITVTGVYYSSYALMNAMNKNNLKPNYYNYNTFYEKNKNLSSDFHHSKLINIYNSTNILIH